MFPERLTGLGLDDFCELDGRGFLAAPGETEEGFSERIAVMRENVVELEKEIEENGRSVPDRAFPLERDLRIPREVMALAGERTLENYGFAINWVPGFYTSRPLGPLWGGCSVTFPERGFSVFLVRRDFEKKERWFLYGRGELLEHELCHVARAPIGDRYFDELFAYRLSPSAFRRYFGNCFLSVWDALLFLLPVMLLLFAQIARTFVFSSLPMYPFWILAGLYPLFLLFRNHVLRRTFFRAKKALVSAGATDSEAVLFRCTGEEIFRISAFTSAPDEVREWIGKRIGKELRWSIINRRFLEWEGEKTGSKEDLDADNKK